jgi:hypothetical protein
VPRVDGGLTILGLGVHCRRGRWRRRHALDHGAAVRLEMGPQRAVAGRLGPEAIPAPLRLVQRDARVVEPADVAEAGADVDVGLLAQFLERRFELRVLAERLDERADGVHRRPVHLLLELGEAARREPRGDPLAVVGEAELRIAGEEVAGAEAVEWRQPAVGAVEVGGERVDVR